MNDLFAAPDPTAGFDEFWARYPRKVGKGTARTAYAKAMKKTTHADLMWALSRQVPCMESKAVEYRPHPTTWLNGERWDDEIEQPCSANSQRNNARGLAGQSKAHEIAARAARITR